MSPIELALYRRVEGRSRFWFSPITALDGLRAIPNGAIISAAEAYMEGKDHGTVELPKELAGHTCGDLLEFLHKNLPLNILNLDLVFEGGMHFRNHDDFETTFEVEEEAQEEELMKRLVGQLPLSLNLLHTTKQHNGHYCLVASNGQVGAPYATFEDYLRANP